MQSLHPKTPSTAERKVARVSTRRALKRVDFALLGSGHVYCARETSRTVAPVDTISGTLKNEHVDALVDAARAAPEHVDAAVLCALIATEPRGERTRAVFRAIGASRALEPVVFVALARANATRLLHTIVDACCVPPAASLGRALCTALEHEHDAFARELVATCGFADYQPRHVRAMPWRPDLLVGVALGQLSMARDSSVARELVNAHFTPSNTLYAEYARRVCPEHVVVGAREAQRVVCIESVPPIDDGNGPMLFPAMCDDDGVEQADDAEHGAPSLCANDDAAAADQEATLVRGDNVEQVASPIEREADAERGTSLFRTNDDAEHRADDDDCTQFLPSARIEPAAADRVPPTRKRANVGVDAPPKRRRVNAAARLEHMLRAFVEATSVLPRTDDESLFERTMRACIAHRCITNETLFSVASEHARAILGADACALLMTTMARDFVAHMTQPSMAGTARAFGERVRALDAVTEHALKPSLVCVSAVLATMSAADDESRALLVAYAKSLRLARRRCPAAPVVPRSPRVKWMRCLRRRVQTMW